MSASTVLADLTRKDPIDERLAIALLDALTADATSDADKRALLLALSARSEAGDRGEDLRALALQMRARALAVRAPAGAVDTCGTGGDGSSSFNVSSAAALVAAAAGVPVVKHGNRAVSSRSGSADFYEALGLKLAGSPAEAEAQLEDTGFTFLFAPAFHPATRAIGPLRKALGRRTAFNLLGPLTNPAAPPFQLVGAATEAAGEALADALSGMPITRAFVVHGSPSWDEATPCGSFLRWDVRPGSVMKLQIDPLFSYGIPRCDPDALAGGDARENVALFSAFTAGVRGGLRDAVLLNAALVLELARDLTPQQALAAATGALDSGSVRWLLSRLGTA
jgi:anthranilate phosphoribosyltransferase